MPMLDARARALLGCSEHCALLAAPLTASRSLLSLRLLRQRDRSLEALTKAIKDDPEDADAFYNRAKHLIDQDQNVSPRRT